jgi:hypothetical protein
MGGQIDTRFKGQLRAMATTGNRGGGRRSKGERRFVGTRVDVKSADQLVRAAKGRGVTVSEFVEATIKKELASMDPSDFAHPGQEELPIGRMVS